MAAGRTRQLLVRGPVATCAVAGTPLVLANDAPQLSATKAILGVRSVMLAL